MKVRNGFVSNSSTSSFCIYGVAVDQSELLGRLTKEAKSLVDAEVDPDADGAIGAWEIAEALNLDASGLELHVPGDWGTAYVGRPYASIQDDETGAQFRANTFAAISKILRVEAGECGHMKEAWGDY